MKIFLDTEFIENGRYSAIQLISIALVKETSETYYAISAETDFNKADDWVKENVLPNIGDDKRKPHFQIASEILEFIGDDKPEFWGYYADYDWVVFCGLFGLMIDLPSNFPMYCRDIKQLADELNCIQLPEQNSKEHNALNDALWNKMAYNYLRDLL